MKKLNELEDTFEAQEKRELIIEWIYKLTSPIIVIIILVLAFIVKVYM